MNIPVRDSSFYIVGLSPDADGGIHQFRLDENGRPAPLSFARLPGATWLIFTPDRRFAYSTCYIDGNANAGVAVFRDDAEDGTLTELQRVSSHGKSACHLTLSPDGQRLFCANYTTGSAAEFHVRPDGTLSEVVRLDQHVGSGPDAERQQGPHVHFTAIDPTRKYLVLCDLGLDSLHACPLDGGPEIVSRIEPLGGGPRHLVFSDNGDQAYLLTEMGSVIHHLAYRDGHFTPIAQYPALAPDFQGRSWAAAIRYTPDHRFLFVTNRGESTVALFRILPDGALAFHQRIPTGADYPRDANFLPGGSYFATANQNGNQVHFFTWQNNRLTHAGYSIPIPHPVQITSRDFP